MVKRKEKGKKKFNKGGGNALFNKSTSRPNKSCPLSGKEAPEINYKNIKLLKKYVSDTAKILPSRITNVSLGKQRALSKEIKKARVLALMPYVGN
jgi:small subunit ribosomal protein S18